jgi:aspartyl-tRNA(Asn)/glutamyl-tRNA(Gln) amidotransferase subunit A
MSDSALAFAPATELARLIASRRVSPVEVVKAALRRAESLNPRLNAFLSIAGDAALAAARSAEKAIGGGRSLPPLHGVPVAIKDLEHTRGIRTTGGSLVYRDFVPSEDSVLVERLERAGAIVLGKTNTPEFGSHSETWNLLGEDGRNPWDPTRTCGGSSGGSAAAVATGMAPLASGTDGAGSIRIPASFCGVYGLKPTQGLVPQHGGFVTLPTLSVPGPLARTVADAALMLEAVAGHDARDPNSSRRRPPAFYSVVQGGVEDLRVAWCADLGFVAVAPEVRAITEAAARAFESLGCLVEEATPPVNPDYFVRSEPIRNADKYAAYGHLLDAHAQELTPYIRSILELGARVTGGEYSRCLRYLKGLRARMAGFFERYDLLLTPATAFEPFALREPPPQQVAGRELPSNASAILLTLIWNLTGQPAASVPCGLTRSGMPVGLQIVGRRWKDAVVVRASAAFEGAHPWARYGSPSLGD